jgi:hypothetical protein
MWSKPEQVEKRSIPLRTLFRVGPERGRSLSQRVDSAFILGVADWALLPTAATAIASFLWRKRFSEGKRRLAAALGVVGLWVLTIAFVIKPRPALDLLPSAYGMVQFPWRLLGLATFFSATGLVLLLHFLHTTLSIRRARLWQGGILTATIAVLLFPIPTRQGTRRFYDMSKLPEYSVKADRRGYTVLGEYAPRTLVRSHFAVLDAAEILRQTPGISAHRRDGSITQIDVDSAAPLRIVLPLIDYDFYHAEIDGGRPVPKYSDQGLVGLSLPPGKYTVTIEPHWNATARWGGCITILSVLVIPAMELRRRKAPRLPDQ